MKWAFILGGAVGTIIAVIILLQPPQEDIGVRIAKACASEFTDTARINSCKIALVAKYAVEADQARLDRAIARVR